MSSSPDIYAHLLLFCSFVVQSNESRPECVRQTLAELLISPVQRLPRIILLLKGVCEI